MTAGMGTDGQKVAIITGASQGIGAGLVTAYREAGHAVVATSRTILPSADPQVLTVRGDIAAADTARGVVDQAIARFGRIDTLVNNAGIFVAKPFTAYTLGDFNLVTGVNLLGFFHITSRVIEQMLEQRSGHVVNITTSLVEHASASVPSALASLSKGGLAAVTKSLATEYAARGIRVNAIAPGIIRTPMHDGGSLEALAAMHPIGRMGEIEDIVGGVLYLEEAPFVTGETLHIDGGQRAGH